VFINFFRLKFAPKMSFIIIFIEDLHEYLTGSRSVSGNIIRKHSKKLDQLGDISFPLNIKNWTQIVDKPKFNRDGEHNIFDLLSPGKELNAHLESLIEKSKSWCLTIKKCEVKNNDVHLYLNRPAVITLCITTVLQEGNYGLPKYFQERIAITVDDSLHCDSENMSLTQLRVHTIQSVASNIINCLSDSSLEANYNVKIKLNSNEQEKNVLVCGSVLNEAGIKDAKTTAIELHKKRALDMQLMAQHKYGIQVKSSWKDYFEKLGKASVIMELLQKKCHKTTKITLNSLQTANKGPSFIFYNCARLSALFKEFDSRVSSKVYSGLPSIDKIDFTLLNQPEEWEMIFIYILQFPLVVISCVCDIKLGTINLHNLILFLSNLSSTFSIYYRRVKILTSSKDHLLPVLYARIYLLKAVQQVFHTALHLLNIEPVREM
jgi:hypothetical protein